MHFDRTRFFQGYTAAFAAPSQSQQAGLQALLAAVEADPDVSDLRWLAYMFATVKHECADTWRPIEEYGRGKGHKYGVPVTVTDPQGNQYTNVYYGRGYVQLTWDWNYKAMGQALGNRLLYQPELALQPAVAYAIMSQGMRKGSFTGKKLGDYINANGADYVNARKIINGLDQAQRIAGYASALEKVLRDSVVAAVPGVPMPAPATAPAPTPAPAPAAPAAGTAPVFSVAASGLNVRSGPGAQNAPVAGSPLPAGTLVDGLEDQAGWKRVRAHGSVNGVAGVTGWVAASFLHPAVAAPA
jgi:putative chitinase